ncbi:MAG TPA: TIGR02281 family clan AA aspartic protease [Sphingomonas sp.]|jgi:aspartyl protease family protein
MALSVAAGGARANRDALSHMPDPAALAAIAPNNRAALPVVRPNAHEVARGADGLFYVHASVNDRPVRFLVDTGASVVVLTADDARAVGLVVSDRHYDRKVDTVGGSTPMAWATLDKVDLAGHEVRGLRAAVVRSGLGVSLLGQNMLSQLDSVTMTADRLTLD